MSKKYVIYKHLPPNAAFLVILVNHNYEPPLDSLCGTKMETADK